MYARSAPSLIGPFFCFSCAKDMVGPAKKKKKREAGLVETKLRKLFETSIDTCLCIVVQGHTCSKKMSIEALRKHFCFPLLFSSSLSVVFFLCLFY